MDPNSIGRPDPDPGGLKRVKMKKNAAKSHIISHKSIKINKIGKMLDPDPHKTDADPKNCHQYMTIPV
jgi:hypothetical protein